MAEFITPNNSLFFAENDAQMIQNAIVAAEKDGCHNFTIENITGRPGDDVVALTGVTASEKAVVIGREGQSFPPERYFDLTFEALDAPEKMVCHNEMKHTYINI